MDSHVIKLSGKAELPEALEIGHNFRVKLEGSITAATKADNHDGTFTHYYKFEPVRVEVVTGLGKTLKGKDPRRRSVQMRSLLMKRWQEEGVGEFEPYYDRKMLEIMQTL